MQAFSIFSRNALNPCVPDKHLVMCPVPLPLVQKKKHPSAGESQETQGEARMNSRKEVRVWKNTNAKTSVWDVRLSPVCLDPLEAVWFS